MSRELRPYQTSNNRSKGQFDKSDFKWSARRQGYICPAGDLLTYRTTMMVHILAQPERPFWSNLNTYSGLT